MSTNPEPIPIADDENPFIAACLMAHALGVQDLTSLPGAWECQVDNAWYVAINPHEHEVMTTMAPRGNVEASPAPVVPYSAYIVYNGWPAGVAAVDGGIFAFGPGANQRTFARACRARAEVGK